MLTKRLKLPRGQQSRAYRKAPTHTEPYQGSLRFHVFKAPHSRRNRRLPYINDAREVILLILCTILTINIVFLVIWIV